MVRERTGRLKGPLARLAACAPLTRALALLGAHTHQRDVIWSTPREVRRNSDNAAHATTSATVIDPVRNSVPFTAGLGAASRCWRGT